MPKKHKLQDLAKSLEDFRAWRNPYLQFSTQVNRISGFIGDLDAEPGLYGELRTSRQELLWLKRQEQLCEVRGFVAMMRESGDDGHNLPWAVERLHAAARDGVDLSDAGTSEEELRARERAYRVAMVKSHLKTLRENAFFADLKEIDREAKFVTDMLAIEGIDYREIGTSAAELFTLRRPAVVRQARRLLDEVRHQTQGNRNTSNRVKEIRVLLGSIREGCEILGISPEEPGKFEEIGDQPRC